MKELEALNKMIGVVLAYGPSRNRKKKKKLTNPKKSNSKRRALPR